MTFEERVQLELCLARRLVVCMIFSAQVDTLVNCYPAYSVLHRRYGDAEDRDEARCTENAHYMIPKLCLLLGVMRHSDILEVKFYKTNGNCAALLTQEALWT